MYAYDRNAQTLQVGAYISAPEGAMSVVAVGAQPETTDEAEPRRELYEVVARNDDSGTIVVENCLTDERHSTSCYRVAREFKLERAAPDRMQDFEEAIAQVEAV